MGPLELGESLGLIDMQSAAPRCRVTSWTGFGLLLQLTVAAGAEAAVDSGFVLTVPAAGAPGSDGRHGISRRPRRGGVPCRGRLPWASLVSTSEVPLAGIAGEMP